MFRAILLLSVILFAAPAYWTQKSIGTNPVGPFTLARLDTTIDGQIHDTADILRKYTRDRAHDTGDVVRTYARSRISDSLAANVRGWVTRAAISDSMRVERTFDSTTARAIVHDTSLILRQRLTDTASSVRTYALAKIHDTSLVLRARLSDTSAALRLALTDPAEARAIVHDTANALTPARIGALAVNGTAANSSALGSVPSDNFVQGSGGGALGHRTTEVANFGITQSGFYDAGLPTDGPQGAVWTHLIRSTHSRGSLTNQFTFDLAAPFGGTTGGQEAYYVRTNTATVPNAPWRQLWHSGNLTSATLPGGPYLPRSAGSGQPLTGDLYLGGNNFQLGTSVVLGTISGAGGYFSGSSTVSGDMGIRAGTGRSIWLGAGTGATQASVQVTPTGLALPQLTDSTTRLATINSAGQIGATQYQDVATNTGDVTLSQTSARYQKFTGNYTVTLPNGLTDGTTFVIILNANSITISSPTSLQWNTNTGTSHAFFAGSGGISAAVTCVQMGGNSWVAY